MSSEAEIRRDKKLRLRILRTLEGAKVGGGLRGDTLRELLDESATPAGRFEDDEHVIRLCVDLEGHGFIRGRDDRTKKWQSVSLDYLHYSITVNGTALVEQLVPANPLVEDDRR